MDGDKGLWEVTYHCWHCISLAIVRLSFQRHLFAKNKPQSIGVSFFFFFKQSQLFKNKKLNSSFSFVAIIWSERLRYPGCFFLIFLFASAIVFFGEKRCSKFTKWLASEEPSFSNAECSWCVHWGEPRGSPQLLQSKAKPMVRLPQVWRGHLMGGWVLERDFPPAVVHLIQWLAIALKVPHSQSFSTVFEKGCTFWCYHAIIACHFPMVELLLLRYEVYSWRWTQD